MKLLGLLFMLPLVATGGEPFNATRAVQEAKIGTNSRPPVVVVKPPLENSNVRHRHCPSARSARRATHARRR